MWSNHGSALATSAHRGFQRLIGTGASSRALTRDVEREGETVDDEAGHGMVAIGQSCGLEIRNVFAAMVMLFGSLASS